MGEQHRLGGLDVGGAGKDRGPLALGERDERALEADQGLVQAVDGAAGPEPKVRCDLIVPRATRLELARDGPDPVRQRRLEVQMDVLEIGIPRDRPVRDVRRQPLESADELGIG